jgi:hypothetical protein
LKEWRRRNNCRKRESKREIVKEKLKVLKS